MLMTDLQSKLERAQAAGDLLAASRDNIERLLAASSSPTARAVVAELVAAGEWEELDDRFFRTLSFGTGGLRGRTIGRVVTAAERGTAAAGERPEHPCLGTNAMNFFNISRATQGLVAYVRETFAADAAAPASPADKNDGSAAPPPAPSPAPSAGRPKIVFAHDTRHFSREFAEFAAGVAADLGCDACLFAGPRSTPELSFAVRTLGAQAGVVITASHNPSHDNGFKCYGPDGCQVVEPHASGIIAKVNAVRSERYEPVPPPARGERIVLGAELDAAYMARLETLVLDRAALAAGGDLRVVYTALHGTGGVIIAPLLQRLGFHFITVPEQDAMDGRFPTVKSPNPENPEALAMAVALADREGCDLVLATDPDCDRMGIAARAADGRLRLLTGNQIGSILAWYRASKFAEGGVITPRTADRCAIIKTFVTTDLQRAIAAKFGVRCVETLTGFKYIGAKLEKYERALPGIGRAEYAALPEPETRRLRLAHSVFFVFGGEESYGYSGGDFVRDKDGNAAAVMVAEAAAFARAQGITLHGLLDRIYGEFGFYLEKNAALVFEGAEGADRIRRLAASYAAEPPTAAAGVAVTAARDFATETVRDCEGEAVPAEKMLMVELENGSRIAVRPSGTEPKIKYYLFARRLPPAGGGFSAAELAPIKKEVEAWLETLWEWLREDAGRRLAVS